MKKDKFLSALSGFLILTALLLTIVDLLCFRRSFYQYEYDKNNTAEEIGMSEEGLMESTNALLDYLQLKREDIVAVTAVNGVEREVFNERETLHMIDVRNLYQGALKARTAMAAAGAGILAVLLYIRRKMSYTILKQAYTGGILILGAVLFVTGVYAAADFTNFWINFHYIFFDNDLFFLDPNTSIMINMFPETFFSDLVFRIVGWFAAAAGGIGILVYAAYNRKKKELGI